MNARFYVSGIARFASADTIVPDPANPQSFNRYAYTLNNPVKFRDPSGHCAELGDDRCWGWYDRTMQMCPECRSLGWEMWGAGYQEEMYYVVKGGWRPYAPSKSSESGSTIQFSRISDSKSDFPIAVPWSKKFGDAVSSVTDFLGATVSGAKTVVAGAGVFGYQLGPLGGGVTSIVADQLEDSGDWVNLGLDAVGEIFNGDTRLAIERTDQIFNYRGTLILGQDVTSDLITMAADRVIPGSGFDLVSNTYDTGYGIGKIIGITPNRLETRISTHAPFLEFVIYGPSVDSQ